MNQGNSFDLLKCEIESFKRLCGHYIIDLVSISAMRSAGWDDEQILDHVLQNWDDDAWPPESQRPTNQSWADYEIDREQARSHIIEVLVGGKAIGHLNNTISAEQAALFFDRFCLHFEEPMRFFAGLGLGDPAYVFLYGIVILDAARAGILWVVEGD